ncbi:MAG: class I SAM-dependent methyltransferase [Acidobacteriota bacterium]
MGGFLSARDLLCPVCRAGFLPETGAGFRCSDCGFELKQVQGIWRALPQEREAFFATFAREYLTVRHAEGRGSKDPRYYSALPYCESSGLLGWQWKIRAATFRCFVERVLPTLEGQSGRALRILDLGSGNGWFCHRMALRGHLPVAVDLLTDELDGLAAAEHYLGSLTNLFPRFQAEMDRLPFTSRTFDLVVFNASLHYSADYNVTLKESQRCLDTVGHLVILDTPFYRRRESGLAMLRERVENFMKLYGVASNSLASQEFLTYQQARELGDGLSLSWTRLTPWYGLSWLVRPIKARLQLRREPSRFHILWGTQAP